MTNRTPMDLIDSLEHVIGIAKFVHDQECAEQQELPEDAEAIRTIQDLGTNHWERLEEMDDPAPAAPAEVDLEVLRALAPESTLNQAMVATMAAAARHCDPEAEDHLNRAMTRLTDFWHRKGPEVIEGVVLIAMFENTP